MNKVLIPFLAVALMAVAAPQARADKWYHSGWVIGGAGLLVGSVVGYELGRRDRPSRHHTRVVYTDNFHTVYHAPVYTEETRVWPIYRRTRVYPLASVRAFHDSRPSTALPPGFDGVTAHPNRVNDEARSESAPMIVVGDNNQNVNITVNQTSARRNDNGESETRTVLNYKADPSVGRLSERHLDVPVTAAD